jgi:hypothetical protein
VADLVDEAAEALYSAPVSAFVAERKRLAAEAKAAGDKAAAAAIGKLAKPSVSAWVVNTLLREGALGALFDAGKRLREGELAAQVDQRAAIAQLRTRAAEILEGDAHAASPAVIQRITTTLLALAATGTFAPDPPGRLLGDRDPPGFEAMAGVELRAVPAPEPAPAAARPALKAVPKVDEERARRERAAAAARQIVADRHAELRRLREDLAQAEAVVARLQERISGVEDALAEADARAIEAQAALDETVR